MLEPRQAVEGCRCVKFDRRRCYVPDTPEFVHPECAVAGLKAAGALMPKCDECDGYGWTTASEHDPRCRGDASCPSTCPVPVQVQCEACRGTGHARCPHTALLQEALSVLGRLTSSTKAAISNGTIPSGNGLSDAASLAKKIEKAIGGEG